MTCRAARDPIASIALHNRAFGAARLRGEVRCPQPPQASQFGDKTVELPVKPGTIGPAVIDIGKLYGQTGMFTFDPGFTSTASTESKITYIDGDAGVLLYRGYPIEQLAEHGDFLETCYLLLYGELPTADAESPSSTIASRATRMVHEQMARFFQRLPPRRASRCR